MKKHIIKLMFLGSALVCSFMVDAQYSMIVEFDDGGTESYAVSGIRSFKFTETNMMVNLNDGDVSTYAIADIAHYSFALSSGLIEGVENARNVVSVYPNPASDAIDIAYENKIPELISIDLADAMGRQTTLVYTGIHHGMHTYKQPLDLPAGVYFCRVVSQTRTLTKPFVIK